MKNIIIKGCFAILLSCFAMQSNAQSLEAKIKNMFSPLNKAEITSGIFMHQSLTFLKPSHFDGVNQADSMALDINKWGMLYGQFRGANTLTNSYLPDPATYINPNKNGIIDNTIPILVNVTQYHYIRQGAILDTLLSFYNNQYHDVVGRTRSPYDMDTSFVCSTLFPLAKSKTVKFVIPDTFIFKNIDLPITNIEIKVGDGSSWQTISPNQLLSVNYADTGNYVIKLRFQINNIWKYCVTKIKISDTDNFNRGGGVYDIEHPEKVKVGDTEISIFSSCPDKKLRKPMIVFEGFPNAKKAKENLFPEILAPEKLDEWLNILEYDIIWVDWPNNESSTAQNADRVINVLEWVNNRKHNDGSNEPNTVIAASFGGPCTKYGILKMHNILHKNSEVDRYFTYDAALKGANFPVGLQAFIKDISFVAGNLVGSVPSLVAAVNYVDGPAPKDLLINRVNLSVTGGVPSLTTGVSPFFLAVQNEIASMEAIKPLTSLVRHIVISNGADFGSPQELMPSKLMDLFFNIDWVAGQPWEPAYDVDMIVHSFADNGTNTTFYERNVRTKVYFDLWHIYIPPHVTEDAITLVGTPTGLDTAPGGNGDPGKKEISAGLDALKSALSSFGQIDESSLILSLNQYCFVPTVSSLDAPIGVNYSVPNPTGGPSVDRFSLSQDASVFNMVTGRNEINQYHVTINPRIANVIKNELEAPVNVQISFPLSGSQIFNTGKSSIANQLPLTTGNNFAGNIEIKDDAQLWINRNGKLGLQSSSNPANSVPLSFVVSIPGSNCANDKYANIEVKDNAKIIVGDNASNNTSTLGLGNNCTASIFSAMGLVLDKNSIINLSGNSLLRFANGGTGSNKGIVNIYDKSSLQVDNGGLFNSEWGATVNIKGGGRLHVKAGGTLRVSHYSQIVVEDGGKLIIDPGANIQLWDGSQLNGEATIIIKKGGELVINGAMNFSGNGFFQFDKDNVLTVNGPTFLFKFIGEGKSYRAIRVNNGAALKIPQNATFDLSNAKIEYTKNSKLELLGTSTGIFDNVLFEGKANLSPSQYNTGIEANYSRHINIDHSNFSNVNLCINARNISTSQGVKVYNSIFENCEAGISTDFVKLLDVYHNDFTTVDYAVKFKDSEAGLVDNCQFDGNHHFRAIGLENYKYFTIKNSNINNYKNGANDAIAVQAENLRSNGVGQLLINNCILTNNNLAVGTPDKNIVPFNQSVNIYVSESNFSNNNIAIRNRGGVYQYTQHYYGLVSLDCSTLDNNDIGVDGENVKLVVDINKNRPNKFLANSPQLYFNICYGYGVTAPSTISAKYQYWSYNGIGGITPNNTMYLLGDCPGGNNTTLDASQKLTAMAACIPLPTGGKVGFNEPDRVCTVTSSSTPIINERFADGYEQLMNGSWSSAEHLMQPIADLTSNLLPASQPICNVYVDYARHLVVPQLLSPSTSAINSRENNDAVKNGSSIKIYPNPATSGFTISTDGELNQVEVFNTLGQKVFNNIIPAKSYYLNTTEWESGIYIVKTKDLSGELKTAKVVVQKDKN